ncbi:MAG TPA: hypothetical protein VGL13_08765, partial [Polyangiaceae bacterium]
MHIGRFTSFIAVGTILGSCGPSPAGPAPVAPAPASRSPLDEPSPPASVSTPAPAPPGDFDRTLQKRHYPNSFSSQMPYDVDERRVRFLDSQGAIREAQREFDIFSWESFLALNWPAMPDGRPDESRTLADATAIRVWSTWRSATTLFLPDGGKPSAWTGAPEGEPTLFRAKAAWRAHTTSA